MTSGFPYDRDTPVKSRCSSCLAGVHHGPQHGGVCECECHRGPYDHDTSTEARETLIPAPGLTRREWALVLHLLRGCPHSDSRLATQKVETALVNGYGIKE